MEPKLTQPPPATATPPLQEMALQAATADAAATTLEVHTAQPSCAAADAAEACGTVAAEGCGTVAAEGCGTVAAEGCGTVALDDVTMSGSVIEVPANAMAACVVESGAAVGSTLNAPDTFGQAAAYHDVHNACSTNDAAPQSAQHSALLETERADVREAVSMIEPSTTDAQPCAMLLETLCADAGELKAGTPELSTAGAQSCGALPGHAPRTCLYPLPFPLPLPLPLPLSLCPPPPRPAPPPAPAPVPGPVLVPVSVPGSVTRLCYPAVLPGSVTQLCYLSLLPSCVTCLCYPALLPGSVTRLCTCLCTRLCARLG